MANYPLDLDLMFIEFPLLQKGLRMCGYTEDSAIRTFALAKHEQIYDFIGVQEAFLKGAEYKFRLNPKDPLIYDNTLSKLERYMTAHLIVLDIYSIMQNIDEAPYANHLTKLLSENMSKGVSREGYVFSMMNASAIGQKIMAMLPNNVNNIGGAL